MTELTPSPNGCDCIGNGLNPDVECQCDECPHYLECFPYTNAPVHEYTIKDADDYIINEWVFKIDETKIEQIRNITNPFQKDHIERCGVFVIAENLGRENSDTIYRIYISIGDIGSDRFHIGCISSPKEKAKADILEWVYEGHDSKYAIASMIENCAVLFGEQERNPEAVPKCPVSKSTLVKLWDYVRHNSHGKTWDDLTAAVGLTSAELGEMMCLDTAPEWN